MSGSAVTSSSGGGSNGSLWEKMVTHRVSLHHVVNGTQEDQAGYDFVATLSTISKHAEECVFPYSVTAGGIAC